jgi:hypothetical protein
MGASVDAIILGSDIFTNGGPLVLSSMARPDCPCNKTQGRARNLVRISRQTHVGLDGDRPNPRNNGAGAGNASERADW